MCLQCARARASGKVHTITFWTYNCKRPDCGIIVWCARRVFSRICFCGVRVSVDMFFVMVWFVWANWAYCIIDCGHMKRRKEPHAMIKDIYGSRCLFSSCLQNMYGSGGDGRRRRRLLITQRYFVNFSTRNGQLCNWDTCRQCAFSRSPFPCSSRRTGGVHYGVSTYGANSGHSGYCAYVDWLIDWLIGYERVCTLYISNIGYVSRISYGSVACRWHRDDVA